MCKWCSIVTLFYLYRVWKFLLIIDDNIFTFVSTCVLLVWKKMILIKCKTARIISVSRIIRLKFSCSTLNMKKKICHLGLKWKIKNRKITIMIVRMTLFIALIIKIALDIADWNTFAIPVVDNRFCSCWYNNNPLITIKV